MKKYLAVALMIGITAMIALKVVFRCVLDEDRAVLYSATTDDSFVFNGVEVRLPWSQIANVFTIQGIILFSDEENRKFSIIKITRPSNVMPPNPAPHQLENYFLRDFGQAMAHPELFDQLQIPRVRNVTWTSSPLEDLRTAVGLLILRNPGGIHHMNPIENASMRGFHVAIRTNSANRAQAYHLTMKNGTEQLLVMMNEGTDPFLSSLLGSIRIDQVPPGFARQTYEQSKMLAETSHGDSRLEKIALLKAIEAASNAPPNLVYYTQVLELCRRDHVSNLIRAWLGNALHFFPASQPALRARFPEFFRKNNPTSSSGH